MSVRLIIYDLDGTLIDSIGDIAGALNFAMESFGLLPLHITRIAGMIGEGVAKLVDNALRVSSASLDPAPIIALYTARYAAHLTDTTTLYPGTREVLESLVPCAQAIVSNKSDALTRAILRRLGIGQYFDMVIGADTISERKPSPAPLLHVLSTLKVLPEDTVMVGDSEIDVIAAKAAHVRAVAVTSGYGQPSFERQADFAIENLTLLPALITSLNS